MNRIYFDVRPPLLTWDDVGGYDEVKERIKEMVCLPLTKGSQMKKMNLTRPTGVLIWGPLGAGITMLAEAAANEAGVGYVYASGQEMLGRPDTLREAFHAAVHEAPAVLFISDLDWLAPRAGASYEWGPGNFRGKPPTFADAELTRVLVEEIDHLMAEEQVMLVGSAYRVDVVDQAVIKEKTRFDRKIFLHPPTEKDREGIFRIYLGRIPNLDAGVSAKELAARTEGYVGWDVENLCKQAILRAMKADREIVTMEDFKGGLSQVIPWLTRDMIDGYFDLSRNDCPHHYSF
jgi:transitional endoplasmic reticulum ATPase